MRIKVTEERLEELQQYKGRYILFGQHDICRITAIEYIKEEEPFGLFKTKLKDVFYITRFRVATPHQIEEDIYFYKEEICERIINSEYDYSYYNLSSARICFLKMNKAMDLWVEYNNKHKGNKKKNEKKRKN